MRATLLSWPTNDLSDQISVTEDTSLPHTSCGWCAPLLSTKVKDRRLQRAGKGVHLESKAEHFLHAAVWGARGSHTGLNHCCQGVGAPCSPVSQWPACLRVWAFTSSARVSTSCMTPCGAPEGPMRACITVASVS